MEVPDNIIIDSALNRTTILAHDNRRFISSLEFVAVHGQTGELVIENLVQLRFCEYIDRICEFYYHKQFMHSMNATEGNICVKKIVMKDCLFHTKALYYLMLFFSSVESLELDRSFYRFSYSSKFEDPYSFTHPSEIVLRVPLLPHNIIIGTDIILDLLINTNFRVKRVRVETYDCHQFNYRSVFYQYNYLLRHLARPGPQPISERPYFIPTPDLIQRIKLLPHLDNFELTIEQDGLTVRDTVWLVSHINSRSFPEYKYYIDRLFSGYQAVDIQDGGLHFMSPFSDSFDFCGGYGAIYSKTRTAVAGTDVEPLPIDPSSPAGLMSLPDNILVLIMQQLDFRSKRSLYAVNRRLHCLWKSLSKRYCLDYTDSLEFVHQLERWALESQALDELRIENFVADLLIEGYRHQCALTDDMVNQLKRLDACQGVETLIIKNSELCTRTTQRLLLLFPNIKKLVMDQSVICDFCKFIDPELRPSPFELDELVIRAPVFDNKFAFALSHLAYFATLRKVHKVRIELVRMDPNQPDLKSVFLDYINLIRLTDRYGQYFDDDERLALSTDEMTSISEDIFKFIEIIQDNAGPVQLDSILWLKEDIQLLSKIYPQFPSRSYQRMLLSSDKADAGELDWSHPWFQKFQRKQEGRLSPYRRQ